MACGDFTNYYEFVSNGQFIDAVFCPYADPVGETLAIAMVFGALMIGFAIFSRSVKPLVILAVFGGAMFFSQLPAAAQNFAAIVIIIMTTIAGYAIWRRVEGTT